MSKAVQNAKLQEAYEQLRKDVILLNAARAKYHAMKRELNRTRIYCFFAVAIVAAALIAAR